MKLFTLILSFSMFFSTVVPCHAGEHDHSEKCEHHRERGHDSPSNEKDNNNEHPCSPFCGYHSSVNSPTAGPTVMIENIFITESVEKIFVYTPTYFYLQEFSIWNPPKT